MQLVNAIANAKEVLTALEAFAAGFRTQAREWTMDDEGQVTDGKGHLLGYVKFAYGRIYIDANEHAGIMMTLGGDCPAKHFDYGPCELTAGHSGRHHQGECEW